MDLSVVLALALAVWITVLLLRGTWLERVVLVAAVVLGLLLPTVLDAVSEFAGPALSSLPSLSSLSF